jgi:hypothetical protein
VSALDPWVSEHRPVISAIRALPRRQAEVVGLHFLAGYSITDTAMIVHVSSWAVRLHLRRGLERLAAGLPPGTLNSQSEQQNVVRPWPVFPAAALTSEPRRCS